MYSFRSADMEQMLSEIDQTIAMGIGSGKTVGAWPVTLAATLKLGAPQQMPVMDMFWGDRCGMVVDPDGYGWMVGTHKAEPTTQEMKRKMAEQVGTAAG